MTPRSACCNICVFIPSANFYRFLPAGLARYQQGELLNRIVADVDTLDHLYLRHLPAGRRFVVIMIVTTGLSVSRRDAGDHAGRHYVLTLLLCRRCFIAPAKKYRQNLTHLRVERYRQQLTSWLQGEAELTILAPANAARAQMEATELQWRVRAQRRQSGASLPPYRGR